VVAAGHKLGRSGPIPALRALSETFRDRRFATLARERRAAAPRPACRGPSPNRRTVLGAGARQNRHRRGKGAPLTSNRVKLLIDQASTSIAMAARQWPCRGVEEAALPAKGGLGRPSELRRPPPADRVSAPAYHGRLRGLVLSPPSLRGGCALREVVAFPTKTGPICWIARRPTIFDDPWTYAPPRSRACSARSRMSPHARHKADDRALVAETG